MIISKNSKKGYTNDGPGRCTYEGYDMNRSYPTSNYTPLYTSRNYTGKKASLAIEVTSIRNFMTNVSKKKTDKFVVVDLHGWLAETLGNPIIGAYYNTQFKTKNRNVWGARLFGYMGKRKTRSNEFSC